MNLDDTIVAIATPQGRGGIGVVRLAGPEAKSIAVPMLRLKHELEAGRAVSGELIDACGAEPLGRTQDPGGRDSTTSIEPGPPPVAAGQRASIRSGDIPGDE